VLIDSVNLTADPRHGPSTLNLVTRAFSSG
jgi:hypothetical protein